MQANMELSSSQILRHPHEYEDENQLTETAGKLSQDFDLKLNLGSTADQSQLIIEENEDYEQEEEEYDDDDDDDEKEFSFATFGSDAISSPISADDVFEDGQIRPVFPLFNQDLLLAHEDFKISESRLPHRPPVEKVFIETPPSSSSEKNAEVEGIAAGPYCAWTKTPDQLSKKSNSTGFSKLWRFKEYMHRSNSDGRDAFVFLNSEAKREVKVVQGKDKAAREGSSDKKTAGDVTGEKKKKVKKTVKTKKLSAHEIYLRNKGYFNTEEDRRKSYLPYKPELVGFFTNVNGGGLTKNVHPY